MLYLPTYNLNDDEKRIKSTESRYVKELNYYKISCLISLIA